MAGCAQILFTARRRAQRLQRPQRAPDLGERNTQPTVGVRNGGANPGGGPGNPHSVTCQRTERPPHTPAALSVHPLHGDCRPGTWTPSPRSPGPHCLTERGRDEGVVPGGGIVAGDGRNGPLTQRSGTHREGENGCIGDRPTGTVDGVRPEWADTLSGSSDDHSNRANGSSVEPGEIGYRARHTASWPRWSTLQPAELSVVRRTITHCRIARRRKFPGAANALQWRGQALSPRGCDGDTRDDKGRRKRSARADAEGVQWPRNGVGTRLRRVAWVTPDVEAQGI